jgi:long-chain fatty acid adenylase/transferase FadD26
MPVTGTSIPDLLRRRAGEQPNATAFTFVDYELDPAGFPESLTWSQVHRRAQAVAQELGLCGSIGDRAAIIAPHGLDYIVAFLGALQAGFIAVPLSVPQLGSHDERVSSTLKDCLPAVILTTSSVAAEVSRYASAQAGHSAPRVVQIDSLDLDSPGEIDAGRPTRSRTAYLQYTSGSTRMPAGVVVSHRNLIANLEQVMSDYFEDHGKVPPPHMTAVSWLPFFHDMGLILGVCAPILAGRSAVLTSPTAFLERPARWIQLLAKHSQSLSGAPNFAFELAVRRTSDEDMAGLDLGDVQVIISGSERIHAATIRRFTERFAPFNLHETVIRPSYGLAEATLYVATARPGEPPKTVRFDSEKLSAGHAKRCGSEGGTELVSYGQPRTSTIRIVDPATRTENPAGRIGEIWVHGDNVAMGYWRNQKQTERTFGARLVNPSSGTPEGPWLRTGDLGVLSEGELFIMGRIKDLLIVDGRNHYPDDIEATIQEITGGRVAAISIPDDRTEQLVAIIELKKRGSSDEEVMHKLRIVKRKVTSAISKSHSLHVADLVLVPPGSIPITTSGKVRRSACVERYRQDKFTRLDVPV